MKRMQRMKNYYICSNPNIYTGIEVRLIKFAE